MTALAIIEREAEEVSFDLILPSGSVELNEYRLMDAEVSMRHGLFAALRAAGFPVVSTAPYGGLRSPFPASRVDPDIQRALMLCGATRFIVERMPDTWKLRVSWG